MCVNIIPGMIPKILPNMTILRTTLAILFRVSSHTLVHLTCNLQCGSNPRLHYWSLSRSHKPEQTLRLTGINYSVRSPVILGKGKDKSRHGCDTSSAGEGGIYTPEFSVVLLYHDGKMKAPWLVFSLVKCTVIWYPDGELSAGDGLSPVKPQSAFFPLWAAQLSSY